MTSHFDRKEPGKFRLLLLSQDISDVRENLPKDTTATLELQESENKTDIDAYIRASAKQIQETFDFNERKTYRMVESLGAYIRGWNSLQTFNQ